MLNESIQELKDTRHILNLRKNLISVGKLASKGYTMTFHDDDCKILKGTMMIALEKKNDTLYLIVGASFSVTIAIGNENPKLWHYWLKHINEKGVENMHYKEKISGLVI